jgi:hypothetical protein
MDNLIAVVVDDARLGDPSDPDLIVLQLIDDWFSTAKGKWVKAHADKVYYSLDSHDDDHSFGLSYKLIAEFTEADAMIYKLQYGL